MLALPLSALPSRLQHPSRHLILLRQVQPHRLPRRKLPKRHLHQRHLLQNHTGPVLYYAHIFDMRISYQYAKRIPFRETARGELASLIDHALALLNEIPPEKRDFGKARDRMIAELS